MANVVIRPILEECRWRSIRRHPGTQTGIRGLHGRRGRTQDWVQSRLSTSLTEDPAGARSQSDRRTQYQYRMIVSANQLDQASVTLIVLPGMYKTSAMTAQKAQPHSSSSAKTRPPSRPSAHRNNLDSQHARLRLHQAQLRLGARDLPSPSQEGGSCSCISSLRCPEGLRVRTLAHQVHRNPSCLGYLQVSSQLLQLRPYLRFHQSATGRGRWSLAIRPNEHTFLWHYITASRC